MIRKGFTLIELIVVIAIIAILSLILIPQVTGFIANAHEATLTANTRSVITMISAESVDYSKSEWYDSWNHNGDGSLNNHIENIWEEMNGSNYENNMGIVNPISDHRSILDYSNTIGANDGLADVGGYRPALFLTNNANYSYAGSGNTDPLVGSIVAYFNNTAGSEYIEFYFVNDDGSKSEFNERFE